MKNRQKRWFWVLYSNTAPSLQKGSNAAKMLLTVHLLQGQWALRGRPKLSKPQLCCFSHVECYNPGSWDKMIILETVKSISKVFLVVIEQEYSNSAFLLQYMYIILQLVSKIYFYTNFPQSDIYFPVLKPQCHQPGLSFGGC